MFRRCAEAASGNFAIATGREERSTYLSSTSTPDAAQELESRWGIRRVVQIPKSRPFEKEEDERRFLLEDGHGKEN
jgi:hypothetical protein